MGFAVAAIILSMVGIGLAAPAPVITSKQIQETSLVSCNKTSKDDSNLPIGTSKVVQACKNGVRTTTYKVIYKNGVEQSRQQVASAITISPINEITSIGTKVAAPVQNVPVSSGSSTSTASASSTDSGPTAQCRDGTYSYAVNHQGACSHHGGVVVWYH